MPLYEYECRDCGRIKEMLVESDKALQIVFTCSHCGCTQFHKIMSVTSPPHFKGDGFYETDYKRKDSHG